MRHRCLVTAGVFAMLSSIVSLAPPQAAAGQSSSAGSYTALRTPWGHPDLQGTWDYRSVTPMERPVELGDKAVLTEEEAARFEEQLNRSQNRDLIDPEKGGALYPPDKEGGVVPYNEFWYDRGDKVLGRRTSLIVDPPNGRFPPLTPAGAARAKQAAEEGRLSQMGKPAADTYADRPLSERCVLWADSVLPMRSTAYNNNVQIVQSPGHVVIHNEMIHENRVVPLDNRPHIPKSVGQWLGDSRARWEGDTLVVETTNFLYRSDFRRSSGERMKVTERFTRIAPDQLLYRYTVDDPETWTRPWTAETIMVASEEPIYEYACHEGNTGMIGILAGARAEERDGRRGSK